MNIGQVTDKSWYEAIEKELDLKLDSNGYTYPGNILFGFQKDFSNRVYLDEYEEQEKLRKRWFAIRWHYKSNWLYIKNNLEEDRRIMER